MIVEPRDWNEKPWEVELEDLVVELRRLCIVADVATSTYVWRVSTHSVELRLRRRRGSWETDVGEGFVADSAESAYLNLRLLARIS